MASHESLYEGKCPDEYCQNRGLGLCEFLSSDCGPIKTVFMLHGLMCIAVTGYPAFSCSRMTMNVSKRGDRQKDAIGTKRTHDNKYITKQIDSKPYCPPHNPCRCGEAQHSESTISTKATTPSLVISDLHQGQCSQTHVQLRPSHTSDHQLS